MADRRVALSVIFALIVLGGVLLRHPVTIVAEVGGVPPARPASNQALQDEASQVVGLRFTDLDIPQGARILSAYLEFAAHEHTTRTSSITIRAQATDDAPTIATTGGNATLGPLTVAGVEWSPAARGNVAGGSGERTPDLAPMFQEVVSRPGWAPGNAVVLVFTRAGQGEAFEGGQTEAPQLHIEYRQRPG
jgi:hypothetical protein